MAGLRDRYNTDRNLEEEGVWVDYGDGLKVKVRRLSSKFSREVRRKLEKPYTAQFRNRDMPEGLQEELLNKQVSQAIVVDWEGVTDDNDKPIVCNPENVMTQITEFPDFRDDILTAAMAQATFAKETMEAGAKNSKSASSGS